MFKSIATFSICAAIALTFKPTPAEAITIIPGIDNLSGGTEYANGSFTLGYEFSLSAPSVVNALGSYDAGGDGLNGTYTIGLWDISGNLLTSASVSGTGDLLASGFRWTAIPDLTLSAGNYVVGSAGDWIASGNSFYYGGLFTTAPELAFVQGRFLLGGTLQFPTDLDTSSVFGGNVSLIPVPGPLPILGFAAALGHSRRLRKRMKDIKSTVDSSVNQGM